MNQEKIVGRSGVGGGDREEIEEMSDKVREMTETIKSLTKMPPTREDFGRNLECENVVTRKRMGCEGGGVREDEGLAKHIESMRVRSEAVKNTTLELSALSITSSTPTQSSSLPAPKSSNSTATSYWAKKLVPIKDMVKVLKSVEEGLEPVEGLELEVPTGQQVAANEGEVKGEVQQVRDKILGIRVQESG